MARQQRYDNDDFDPRPSGNHIEKIRDALEHAECLNDWEINFLYGLAGFQRLSGRQADKLNVILEKGRLVSRTKSKANGARDPHPRKNGGWR